MKKHHITDYTPVEKWEQLPDGYHHRDVCGMDVDDQDRVYVLTRGESRVLVYEKDGRFVESWGDELLTNGTHGIRLGSGGAVFCVSNGEHTVHKFSADGKLEFMIGTPGVASKSGGPFNAPTGIDIAPNGEFYVSDGYGNSRVHHFSADGEMIRSWGEPGTGPGQFALPHSVCYTNDDRVLVADRENNRIQVFTPEGRFVEEWTHLQRPTDIYMDVHGFIYVSELKWLRGEESARHGTVSEDLHGRVSVLDSNGEVLLRIGGPDGTQAGSFWAPHGLCVDSGGDIYVGEVSYSFGGFGERGDLPSGVRTLQKLAKNQ